MNADGCHIGQKDMNINEARKTLKNKIIGITCHNSIKLAKIAISNKVDYLAFGAFNNSKTKKTSHLPKQKSWPQPGPMVYMVYMVYGVYHIPYGIWYIPYGI